MISGFITNLGKYNEGELVGEWIEFPISDEDLQDVLTRIGIGSSNEFGSPYEEYFFTDWDLPDGLNWEIFGETPNIKTVNEVAEAYQGSSYSDEVVSAVLMHYNYDLDEALIKLRDGDFMFYSDVSDAKSLGEYVVNNVDGGLENLGEETLQTYFDYEAYGRDIEISGNIEYLDSGAIEFFK